mmetsp:Transcript_7246/g.45346  ORF Transcript_7246/g.45346 Transcript_7246/m.45346 type:complete len:85 (-) Transcript_7246:734-988(-)
MVRRSRCKPSRRAEKDFEMTVEYNAVERERRRSPFEEDHHSCDGQPARLDVQLLPPKEGRIFSGPGRAFSVHDCNLVACVMPTL